MAPKYPEKIVSFTERSLVNWNHAGRQNLLQDEIEAIQAELGVLPKGGYADVAARLAAVAGGHTQNTDTALGTQAEALDMGGYVINDVGDPVLGHDAVNLNTLLDSISIALEYFFGGSSVMAQAFSAAENHVAEVVTGTPQELTTITQVSAADDTPAPFTVTAGELITVHFDAKVLATSGKKPTFVYAQLGYVDADGSSNFVQIGADSDPNPVALTTAKTMQEQHVHVSADTTVPAGKRLKLKWWATTTEALQNPTIWVYYGAVGDHMHIPVSASILKNFLLVAGDLNHEGSNVGFYGTTPIAQAVLATGVGATVDDVITAIQNLGLVKQS